MVVKLMTEDEYSKIAGLLIGVNKAKKVYW